MSGSTVTSQRSNTGFAELSTHSFLPRGFYARMDLSLPREVQVWIAEGERKDNDSLLLTLNRDLQAAFRDENCQPNDCLQALLKDPYLQELYQASAKVAERMSVKQHTFCVLGQMARYLWNDDEPPSREQRWFSLALALHDIGKSAGITARDQHIFTGRIIELIRPALPLSAQECAHLVDLCTEDPIGNFIVPITFSTYWREARGEMWGRASADKLSYADLCATMEKHQAQVRSDVDEISAIDSVVTLLRRSADKLRLPIQRVCRIQLQFYQMDTSSYSLEGSKLPALERIYEMNPDWSPSAGYKMFTWDRRRQRLQFRLDIEALIRDVEDRCGF